MTQDLVTTVPFETDGYRKTPPAIKVFLTVELPVPIIRNTYVGIMIPPHTEGHSYYFHVCVERAILQGTMHRLFYGHGHMSTKSSSEVITVVCLDAEQWFSSFLHRISNGFYRDRTHGRISVLTSQSISFESGLGIATASPLHSTLYAGIIVCLVRKPQDLIVFDSFLQRHQERLPIVICYPSTISIPIPTTTISLLMRVPNVTVPVEESLSSSFQSISLA